jgi:hypothetical protein
MELNSLEQIARTAPNEFLAVRGFGKKCLYELSDILEKFYSRLDIRRLRSFADIVELWRPFFPHPDRVSCVPYNPRPSNPDESAPSGDQAGLEPFEPARNSIAKLRAQDLPISTRARNVLRVAKIKTVNDLAQISPSALIKVGNCGRGTIAELANLLEEYFASLPVSGIRFYHSTRPSWLRRVTSATPRDEQSRRVLFQPQARPVMEVMENA